jgi:hypothetical protein
MNEHISEMDYDIVEHIHRYACWAASRAASTSKAYRFTVQIGRDILNNSGLRFFVEDPDALPSSQAAFNTKHSEWRKAIIESSGERKFTHGVAAKLINVYLKTIIICGGHHAHPNARFIHPPIDSVLLKELIEKNKLGMGDVVKSLNNKTWSNFNSDDYEHVIGGIVKGLNGEALWKVEKYWQGHR